MLQSEYVIHKYFIINFNNFLLNIKLFVAIKYINNDIYYILNYFSIYIILKW